MVGRITKNVKGKLLANKGYIRLFKYLYSQGIELIHKIKSNMKNKLVLLENKLLLKKRGVVESVILHDSPLILSILDIEVALIF